jgi:amidophosphoribosyltransferase
LNISILARPDSIIDGQSVHESQAACRRYLAQEYPIDADVVIGVPDSGLVAAKGYAMESGIPTMTVHQEPLYWQDFY